MPIERGTPLVAKFYRPQRWSIAALAEEHGFALELAAAGIAPERTVLLGFSQGACLSLEFAARHAQRFGGVVALSGGLIGPPGTPRDYEGAFDGTPVFLGCGDRDPHIPADRVHESAEIFRRMGARVTERIYPGLGHTVNQDELAWVTDLISALQSVRAS